MTNRPSEEDVQAVVSMLLAIVIVMLVGLLLSVLLSTPAHAQPIPREAVGYKHLYTRLVRAEWGLTAPVASLAAQVHQESTWRCDAVSRAGARSCTQFMPATAKWMNEIRPDLAADAMYSPRWAFRSQAIYMKWLHDRVKGPAPCERMAFSMSAYNGGLGYVLRRQKLSPRPLVCFGATCDINPGITPANQAENAHYPRRILRELEPKYIAAGWGSGSCAY